MFCTVEEVINFTGLKPHHLNLSKDDDEKLEEIITKWISQSESLIKSYLHNSFKNYGTDENPIPEAVANVCLRLTSNMVSVAIARRDTPITQHDDYNMGIISSKIFTNDLKEDLQPWYIDKSNTSDAIDIFAITGAKDG